MEWHTVWSGFARWSQQRKNDEERKGNENTGYKIRNRRGRNNSNNTNVNKNKNNNTNIAY